MKNEIIHGKTIIGEDIIEYEEEYRSPYGYIFFGLRDRIFINCIFEDIENLFEYMVGCTFKSCVFKDIVFDSYSFVDDSQNTFEDCMFFNCEIEYTNDCDNINLPESTNMKCPRYDRIIGYKIIIDCDCTKFLLATLEIPTGVKRSSAIGNKCRCEYAKVLSIMDENGNKYDIGRSTMVEIGNQLTYKVGEYVYADSFDENRFHECAPGIHFFMTPEEAWDHGR